jgi:polyhydroxyalkanoate synthesis regulator phasin
MMPVYDKAKAHEYYLRNRHLKGRRRGGDVPPTGNAARLIAKHAPKKKSTNAHAAEIDALKARLEKLRGILAKLVEQAKKRSGVETPKKGAKKAADGKGGGGKDGKGPPLTAKQKRDAAARAKKSYEKNKDKNKQSSSNEIEALQKKIADIRAKIKDAIEKAHKQSKSKTAGKAVRH